MNDTNFLIEETWPDGSFHVIWRGTNGINNADEALKIMAEHTTKNRIELWSKAHANSPKGFSAMAYRAANSDKVMFSNTLKMLMNSPQA